MSKEENISLFDDYLSDSLSTQEKLAFEGRLDSDENFKNEFEEYRLTFKAIADGAEYDAIKVSLEGIHGDLYGQSKKKVFILRPRYYIPAAAAILAVSFWIADPFGGAGSEDTANVDYDYSELSANTDSTVMYESDYSDDEGAGNANNDVVFDSVVSENFPLEDSLLDGIRSRPEGSCFLISKNGYFVTAKHLLRRKRKVRLQQKDLGFTFYATKVYVDSLLDFAILKCDEKVVHLLENVPYKFYRKDVQLGQEVFTLGYPKKDIVYTEGSVGSETGWRSDSNYFEISMPANPGNSGAPLFTEDGAVCGIIAGNNTKKQSVTYVVPHNYIHDKINELVETDSLDIDMSTNRAQRYRDRTALIEAIRPFIFEIHYY